MIALHLVMNGRRSHPRFSIALSEGVLSVLREVTVRRTPTGELLAVDREPRQVGELLMLETFVDTVPVSTLVQVVGGHTEIRNGTVHHELRLLPLTPDAANKETR